LPAIERNKVCPYQMMLGEISLNPSVEAADELRLEGQCRTMFGLFCSKHKTGLLVTTAELMEIAGQYNARLNEIRHALVKIGWCIDLVKKARDGNNGYKLVRLEDSTFYAEHKESFDV